MAIDASVEIRGLKELIVDLKQFPEDMQKKTIFELSVVAFDSAQKGAGKHIVTGALFQSLFNKAIPGGRQVGHDTKRAPYAKFVIQGTKPHKIPKKANAKVLRWAGPNGFVFRKSVNHPGYAGDPYMDRALNDALIRFDEITREALKESF